MHRPARVSTSWDWTRRVEKVLRDVGYETPSPIQAEAIPPLLEGQHVVGLAQTGTGKTAAFALPILSRIDLSQKSPQVLVLAPTRELALQVSEAFGRYAAHLKGLHVLPVYGGQGYGVQLSRPAPRRARRRRHAGPRHGPPREGHARPERAALRRARRGRRDAQHGLRRGRRDDPRRHPGRQAAGPVQRDDPAADPADHQEVRARRHRDHRQVEPRARPPTSRSATSRSPTRRSWTPSRASSRSRTSTG